MHDDGMPEKICGRCIWHHDLYGTNEREGVKNCLALRWPEVLSVVSTERAQCIVPESFIAKGDHTCKMTQQT